MKDIHLAFEECIFYRTVKRKQKPSVDEKNIIIPSLALNDVFIGETLSSRVSYYEIQCNGGESVKQKSSGVLICTGSILSGVSLSYLTRFHRPSNLCAFTKS